MNCDLFKENFSEQFHSDYINFPSVGYELQSIVQYEDYCYDVMGMTSIKKQKLLNLAASLLDTTECYFEVGTFNGKSLISAMHDNLNTIFLHVTIFLCLAETLMKF